MLSTAASRLDRRIVDTAEAGNPVSEASHGYVGDDVSAGMADGKTFRQARGWMRYALTTFDDTEVTVACTFVGSEKVSRNYDVIVEDSVIAARTFTSESAAPVVVEIKVPFALTKGKTNIAVVIRARGDVTPALRELRIIQDHNEVESANYALVPHLSSPSLQKPSGVAR